MGLQESGPATSPLTSPNSPHLDPQRAKPYPTSFPQFMSEHQHGNMEIFSLLTNFITQNNQATLTESKNNKNNN